LGKVSVDLWVYIFYIFAYFKFEAHNSHPTITPFLGVFLFTPSDKGRKVDVGDVALVEHAV